MYSSLLLGRGEPEEVLDAIGDETFKVSGMLASGSGFGQASYSPEGMLSKPV